MTIVTSGREPSGPLKVIFVCASAARLFRASATARIGGAEIHTTLLARGLAAMDGCDSGFVVYGEGAMTYESHGVRVQEWPLMLTPGTVEHAASVALQQVVMKVHLRRRWPWLRFQQFDWSLLWQMPVGAVGIAYWWRRMRRTRALFRALEADVYCFMKPTMEAMVGLECNAALGRRSVLLIANDSDLSDYVYEGSMEVGPKDATYGYMVYQAIDKATHIVVQTEYQQRMLSERFGRASTLIRNPIRLEVTPMPAPVEGPYVLWVGRGDEEHKRPRLCFDLARRCPELHFVMVMNPVTAAAQRALKADAPANVTVVDFVPYEQMDGYFQHASAFVSTSAFEGLPNTFLQAGKHGLPVFSLMVDPDAMIRRHEGGAVTDGDISALAVALRRTLADPAKREACGQRLRAYVEQHHELEQQVAKLAAVLRAVAAGEAPVNSPPEARCDTA